MRRWIGYAALLALAAVLGLTPFESTDVGKLRPVQTVRVCMEQGMILIETDTGDSGSGTSLSDALADLKLTTPDRIYLETAEQLVLQPGCENMLEELSLLLRPSCGICLEDGKGELSQVGEYLSAHEPQATLLRWRGGEKNLPTLVWKEGKLSLVS